MAKYIFFGVFLFAYIFQWIWWNEQYLIDWGVWEHQAEYVETNNPEQFNKTTAYGHPGGTVIDGTIFIHEIFKVTFEDAVLIFLNIFNSILIALISVMCYLLRKNSLWWLAVGGLLSVDSRMYQYLNPPSDLVSLLGILLFLITLYIYENKDKIGWLPILFWSLVAGLAVSSRSDVGPVIEIACIIPVFLALGWEKTILAGLGSFTSFVIFDPFMWFIPLRHIYDLVAEMFMHYKNFARPQHLGFFHLMDISSWAIVSIFTAIMFILFRKKIKSPIPNLFLYVFLGVTAFLSTIFLTASYQAERYFVPLIFIWETFLPLFLFSLISNINLDFVKTTKNQNLMRKFFEVLIIILIVGLSIYYMFEFIWINNLY